VRRRRRGGEEKEEEERRGRRRRAFNLIKERIEASSVLGETGLEGWGRCGVFGIVIIKILAIEARQRGS